MACADTPARADELLAHVKSAWAPGNSDQVAGLSMVELEGLCQLLQEHADGDR